MTKEESAMLERFRTIAATAQLAMQRTNDLDLIWHFTSQIVKDLNAIRAINRDAIARKS